MMDSAKEMVRLSKFLSLVLRHQPEAIGLKLDPQGWVDVDELIIKARTGSIELTRELIAELVRESDKQRFALSADGDRIRANQGHSVVIDPDLPPVVPPSLLYHGTAGRFVASIQQQGLLKGTRLHVHLSSDEATARIVGMRHGRPVIFRVDAAGMHSHGSIFYCSANGVWLTDHVPAQYLELIDS